jgi:hypothetical protein
MSRKRAFLAIPIVLVFSLLASSQQVIENPEKPLAKNAGRVLDLKEVWRITDEGGQFYFKYPYSLKIAPDGSIFLAELEQFLKFSSEGKFVKNLYKKGQGPGEIERDFTYHLYENEIFIEDFNSGRLWRTDLDGNFLSQINLGGKDYRDFIGVRADSLVFLKSVWPPLEERTGKLMDILDTVALVSKDGKPIKDVHTFRLKMFLAPRAASSWDYSQRALSQDGKWLFGYHGREYLIEVLDFEKGEIIRRFNRKYPHVKHVEEEREADFRKKYNAPRIEFESDVQQILLNVDRLLVKTSTKDKNKGDLFDVFDGGGHFLDSFYLGPGRTLLAAVGDMIFVLEKDPEENFILIKYNIMG